MNAPVLKTGSRLVRDAGSNPAPTALERFTGWAGRVRLLPEGNLRTRGREAAQERIVNLMTESP